MDEFLSLKDSFSTDEEGSAWDDFQKQCSLSWTTRIWGFIFCFGIGTLMTILSAFLAPHIVTHPSRFAVPYSIGSVCSILSSMFLMGFTRQIKLMFKPTRAIAALIYILSIIATLLVVFMTQQAPLTLLCIIVQFCSLLWYCASYIPFARRFVKNLISGLIC